MYSPSRWLLALPSLAILLGPLFAQEPEPPKNPPKPGSLPFRDFFKKPETTQDFWEAISFEIEVGRYDLAAKLLHAMMDPKPDERQLGDIADKEGLSTFLKLRNVPQWSKNDKEQVQAKKDVEELIKLATDALKKKIGNEDAIKRYVTNLNAEPEKRDYAIGQLIRVGSVGVPYMIEALARGSDDQRPNILYALEKMGKNVVTPLLASLDMEDPKVKAEIIGVLERRAETAAVPFLWHIAASPKNPDSLRKKARDVLTLLLGMDPSKLPAAKEMLTREAERYYRHQVKFPDRQAVTVWRWENGRLVAGWPGAATVGTSQAEEYYGLKFAGQALDLDPEYKPAQLAFLSLALDKAMERSGLDKPLGVGDPRIHDLLATINPDLVMAVLERGLADSNQPVILGAVRSLAEFGELKAARPIKGSESMLSRVLNFPNRRISFAAADALLRIPGPTIDEESRKQGREGSNLPTVRILDELRRAVAAEPTAQKARILIVHNNVGVLDKIDQAMKQAGYDTVPVRTGKEALRRLNEAADIDAIVVDERMPDPELPYFLGEARGGVPAGLLPILVLTPAEREPSLRRMTERYRNVHLVPPGFAIDVDEGGGLKKILPALIVEAVGKPMDAPEQQAVTERALMWLTRLAKGEKKGFDLRPTMATVVQAVRSNKLSPVGMIYGLEVLSRLPGERPQLELANVIADPMQPVPVRGVAAAELVRHMQTNGVLLRPNQVKAIQDLHAAADTDAGLRGQVSLVLGNLRPDSRGSGDRLKGFVPPPPQPPPPKDPPKDPEKDKEKEKDK